MLRIFCYIFVLLAFKFGQFESQDIPAPPPPVCCFKDFVVSDCYNSCSERTCANLKRGPVFCPLYCQVGVCECKDGLYRNECNECVPKEKCGTPCNKTDPIFCTKPNETLYGCLDVTQDRVCSSVSHSNPRDLFLKYIEQPNTKSLCVLNTCDCIEGYLRNSCGKCVLPQDCGKTPRCDIQCDGLNEVVKIVDGPRVCHTKHICLPNRKPRRRRHRKLHGKSHRNPFKRNDCKHSKCKRSPPRRRNCHVNVTMCTNEPKYECVCKDGFVRNKCGVCVPSNQAYDDSPCVCTNPCRSNPDMEWQCANDCTARTCDNFYTLPLKLCSAECSFGCYCSANKNLWWDGSRCVKNDSCPPPTETTTPNACTANPDFVWQCVNGCNEPTCFNYFTGPTKRCMSEPCTYQCQCGSRDGEQLYWDGSRCVLGPMCPPLTTPPPNQCDSIPGSEYQCMNACNATTCDNYNIPRTKLCVNECTYGCYCSSGLWWDGSKCVPGDQCPPRSSTPNPCTWNPDFEWQCTNNCSERTCENSHKQYFAPCSLSPCTYGCSCSISRDLWWNGTCCVKKDMCPPVATDVMAQRLIGK